MLAKDFTLGSIFILNDLRSILFLICVTYYIGD